MVVFCVEAANKNPAAQEITRRTGISIEIQQPMGNPDEKLKLCLQNSLWYYSIPRWQSAPQCPGMMASAASKASRALSASSRPI